MCNFKSVVFDMKIKLNTDLSGFRKGRIINVNVDEEGTILNQFWRARLEDSKIDNCVEVVIEKKTKSNKRAK